MSKQLLNNEGNLLKKFCKNLRIACKTPDRILSPIIREKLGGYLDDFYLKPFGDGWPALIDFLYKHKELLTNELELVASDLLFDSVQSLNIAEDYPTFCREAGLLAHYLLDDVKDAYGSNDYRTNLISVIIKSYPMIKEEFEQLLNKDVFIDPKIKLIDRPVYADELCEMIFSLTLSGYVSKYNPDLIIKLAVFEWFVRDIDTECDIIGSLDFNEYFGLHNYKYDYSLASGLKGPFMCILNHSPGKGLNFIIDILNRSVQKYVHSNMPVFDIDQDSKLKNDYDAAQIEPLNIILNDGTVVSQYCNYQLWGAYRGFSRTPGLIQCALMALENWLINNIDKLSTEQIETYFDEILRKSNCVMTTAVLASIATGYPNKVGKAAFPILRTYTFYELDLKRCTDENDNDTTYLFKAFREPYSEYYIKERRDAANRIWRTLHLEDVIESFQGSSLRNEALEIIDHLIDNVTEDDNSRLFFLRIDKRVLAKNNKQISEVDKTGNETDDVQKDIQFNKELESRFKKLYLWIKNDLEKVSGNDEYFISWKEVLDETRNLMDILNEKTDIIFKRRHYLIIVTSVSTLIKYYASEMNDKDIEWCIDIIFDANIVIEESDNLLSMMTVADTCAIAVETLPILLDYSKDDEVILKVKQMLVNAVTHSSIKIQLAAAEGIRKYLWDKDRELAENCIVAAINYAKYMKDFETMKDKQKTGKEEFSNIQALSRNKIDDLRKSHLRGRLVDIDIESISFNNHSGHYLPTSCYMLPYGSNDSGHVRFMVHVLKIFLDVSICSISYEQRLSLFILFAKHLINQYTQVAIEYVNMLKLICNNYPIDYRNIDIILFDEARIQNKDEVYWNIWKTMAPTVQKIAEDTASLRQGSIYGDERIKLIQSFLKSSIKWEEIDWEKETISCCKEEVEQFVVKTGNNPIVFEAMSKLITDFPKTFLLTGIMILAEHQKQDGDIRLFSGQNTLFHLENTIKTILEASSSGRMNMKLYKSVFILLDGMIKAGSSRAYILKQKYLTSVKPT